MTQELAIALAQLNPTVGDIAGNLAKIREARGRGRARWVPISSSSASSMSAAIRRRIWC